MQDRSRTLIPPPHVFEHWVQLDHSDQAPSTSPAPDDRFKSIQGVFRVDSGSAGKATSCSEPKNGPNKSSYYYTAFSKLKWYSGHVHVKDKDFPLLCIKYQLGASFHNN